MKQIPVGMARVPNVPKVRRLLVRTAILAVFFTVLLRSISDRRDGVTRDSPVHFPGLPTQGQEGLWPPENPVRIFNGTYIDGRYRLVKHLKDGGQGSVSLYTDTSGADDLRVVVKTISALSRNRIPEDLLHNFREFTQYWPSEIEASLTLTAKVPVDQSPYVAVHDYFILSDTSRSTETWSWALVTPFVGGGTIIHMAHKQQEELGGATVEKLDQTYRGAIRRLITNL